jgi:hypothetical protein
MALSFRLWGCEIDFRFVAKINQDTSPSFTQRKFKLQAIAHNEQKLSPSLDFK